MKAGDPSNYNIGVVEWAQAGAARFHRGMQDARRACGAERAPAAAGGWPCGPPALS
jgi:hypothetical protein